MRTRLPLPPKLPRPLLVEREAELCARPRPLPRPAARRPIECGGAGGGAGFGLLRLPCFCFVLFHVFIDFHSFDFL